MNQQKISSDLIRGHIDTIILHSLEKNDKNAQQISDYVSKKSNGEYEINQATLYSSLKRLENLKYISSYFNESPEGRRKFYKVTPIGNEFVSSNLSSWSYSRLVLDKLMDTETEKTDGNSTIIFSKMTDNFSARQIDKSLNTQAINEVHDKDYVKIEEKSDEIETSKELCLDEKNENPLYSNKAKNFRNILNGLIMSNIKEPQINNKNDNISSCDINDVNNTNEDDLDIINSEDNKPYKEDFNKVIKDLDYNEQKFNNNGKIDYGDLTLKAAQEGYKIKISSKDSAKPIGSILENRIIYTSVLYIFIISLFELGTIVLTNLGVLTNGIIISSILVLLLLFLISSIIYFKNPNKKTNKKFDRNKILNCAIICFNLLLIIFALNFVFETDFNNRKDLILYLIFPLIITVNYFLFNLIEHFVAKKEKHIIKV